MGVCYSNVTTIWTMHRLLSVWFSDQTGFQTTIQIPDHLTTRHTIGIPDDSGIQMVTVVLIAKFSGLITVFRARKAHARLSEPELDLYLTLNIDLTRTGLFPLSLLELKVI